MLKSAITSRTATKTETDEARPTTQPEHELHGFNVTTDYILNGFTRTTNLTNYELYVDHGFHGFHGLLRQRIKTNLTNYTDLFRQPVQLGQLFCCAQRLIIITHY